MSTVLNLIVLLLSSVILAAILTVVAIDWVKRTYTPTHTWSEYDLYGLLIIFPVGSILFFISLCICAFSQGLIQLTMAIPIAALTIFIVKRCAAFY